MAWVAIATLAGAPAMPCHAQAPHRVAPSVPSDPQAYALLRLFVRHFGKGQVNHVYVAPVVNDDGSEHLYACWKEGHSILLLEHFLSPVPEDPESALRWLDYKARIDLKTDVVETREEIRGSTYLVDRPWVDRILDACRTRGKKIVANVG